MKFKKYTEDEPQAEEKEEVIETAVIAQVNQPTPSKNKVVVKSADGKVIGTYFGTTQVTNK